MSTALVLFGSIVCQAQQRFEWNIPLGPHAVGFHDTLLFVEDLTYQGHGYQGPAPLFVQHWFPLAEPPGHVHCTYGGLRERRLPGALLPVYQDLLLRMDSAYIGYYLSGTYHTREPISFAPFTAAQVLDTLKAFGTNSHRTRPRRRTDAPVIVYHHGAQGQSDENHFMAEYFASRGYAFVSANFHWPLEDKMYGTPITWAPSPAALHALIRHARGLGTSDSVFVIGHSMGAQAGWMHLHTPGIAQAFVSMETTIEFKSDTAEIRDLWAQVHRTLKDEGRRVPMPVLAMANTRTDAPFGYFAGHSTGPMLHATAKADLGHDSYTSAFHLRHFLQARYPQPDGAIMAEQLALYGEHLRLIGAFFDAVRGKGAILEERFQETFFLHRTP